jgi:hypothetical protein
VMLAAACSAGIKGGDWLGTFWAAELGPAAWQQSTPAAKARTRTKQQRRGKRENIGVLFSMAAGGVPGGGRLTRIGMKLARGQLSDYTA